MSQEKVDKYKEEKANRKAIMKKEKAVRMVRRTVTGVVALALVGWIGYSGYDMYKASWPRPTAEVDYTAIDEYVQGLQVTDEAE